MRGYPDRGPNPVDMVRSYLEKVLHEIRYLDNQYVMKASLAELENYYVEKAIIPSLVLHTEECYRESEKSQQVDVSYDSSRVVFPGRRAIVPGTRLVVVIPCEGDQALWRACISRCQDYPEVKSRNDAVVLTIVFPDDRAETETLKAEIDRRVESVASAVRYLNQTIEQQNRSAPEAVRQAVRRKRKQAEAAIGAVTALDIPLKRRDRPATYTVPIQRRPPPVARPRVPSEPYRPEPALEETEYQHILTVMRDMSLVIERNPRSFSGLVEETIRDHFLIQLNGHYEGGATGETFNASGKTDILIREGDRNVFIAECKFWRGQKEFGEAIDQLLGYLSWRDAKCALLIFNRNRDSSAVRAKMHEVMQGRPEHRKTVSFDADGDARYVFVKESDPGREIAITTQLYDVPLPEENLA